MKQRRIILLSLLAFLLINNHSYGKDEVLIAVGLNGSFGYINTSGKVVVPLKYDYAKEFTSNLAVVKKRGKYGYINKRGDEVIPLEYNYAFSFKGNFAAANSKGKWGLINTQNKVIIPFEYQAVSGDFSEGLLAVKKNGKWGYININNEITVPFEKYLQVGSFNYGIAFVINNKGAGAIDKKGNYIIPLVNDEIQDCEDGMVRAKKNGKYGYYNSKGKLVISFQYRWAKSFHEGLAFVGTGRLNDKNFGYIDKTGIIQIQFTYPKHVYIGNDFFNGLAQVRHLRKNAPNQGLIDKTGKIVLPRWYWGIGYKYKYGLITYYNMKNKKWGLMDRSGVQITKALYDWILY